MRLLTQISPECLQGLSDANPSQARGFVKWLAQDCFLCSPTEKDLKHWRSFLSSSPQDLQYLFVQMIKWYAVTLTQKELLACGHWPGVDLVLTTGACEGSCSCGAELADWTSWSDAKALEALRDLRARPMLKGKSREEELGDRIFIFLRFCTTITIIDRYLTDAAFNARFAHEKVPGIDFFAKSAPPRLERAEIICANHSKEKYKALYEAVVSSELFDNIDTLIWRASDNRFKEHAHHRLIGFTIKGRTHTISLDKGLSSLANDPLKSDIPSQYMAPETGVGRTKMALNFDPNESTTIPLAKFRIKPVSE